MQAGSTTVPEQLPPVAAEAPAAAPARRRLVDRVFSFPAVCAMVVTLLILGFASRRFVEPDFWWHLRNGQQIVEYHSIPRIDTYTFGAAGSPWLDHEWLSEAMFFLAYKAFALRGVLLLYFGLLTLIYGAVYYLAFRRGADPITAMLVTALAVLLGAVSIGPRPMWFGWVCMMGLLLILDRFERTGAGLWLLPLLFALWINLHGSWVFGMVVLAITIAAGLVEGRWAGVVARRWSPPERRALLLASTASVATLFVTPFGYRLLLYPFDLLFRQNIAMKYVEEWQSVDFAKGSGKLALITVLALLLSAVFSRRRWRLADLLLLLFALWMGLSHVRLLSFLGIIMAPVLAPRLNLFPPTGESTNRAAVNAVILAVLVGCIVYSFPTQAELERQLRTRFPAAALEYMQREHITGRVLNEDWWGGYVEWNLPTLKPFIDSRADIFVYNGAFDDYISAVRIRKPFAVLDKHRIDYALLEPNEPLVYVLKRSPNWQAIYSDNIAVLLARTDATGRAPLPQNGTDLDRGSTNK